MSEETSLVHRPVRSGALLLSLAALQFLVVLLAVEMRYPSYSFSRDTILSLGGSSSPWALAFNLSLIAFGLLGVFGLLLIASAFDSRPSRGLAFLVMLAGAIGLVGMGTFPETAFAFRGTALHVSTYVVIVAAIAGLFLLSFAMLRTERWRVSRPYTGTDGDPDARWGGPSRNGIPPRVRCRLAGLAGRGPRPTVADR